MLLTDTVTVHALTWENVIASRTFLHISSVHWSNRRMHTLLFVVSVLFAHALAGPEPRAPCPAKCDITKCPAPRAACQGRRVLDRCGCCALCAAGEEGTTCGRKRDPPCAAGLECVRSGGKKSSKGVCRCKSSHPVCGSDGTSYVNQCRLEAASRRARQRGTPPVTHVHKDRCASATSGMCRYSSYLLQKERDL